MKASKSSKTKVYYITKHFLQPKIQTASKFERRADNKTYEDKIMLFDGVCSA